jgi:hypothetical protein
MAKFFNPDDVGDNRLHAPAIGRNRDVLKEVFIRHMPKSGALVEVASGTGEHAYHIAPSLKPLLWQPTDIENTHLKSIDAWRMHLRDKALESSINILPAKRLDIMDGLESVSDINDEITAICAINLIHIAPFDVCERLMMHAGITLKPNGVLFLYGPYKKNGEHTSETNAAFDQSLKSRNSAWGIRDMETIHALADKNNFTISEVIPMPANNFSLVYRKLS